MYCNEPNCDCRRVFFTVLDSQGKHQAIIAWGWEDLAFYKRWLGFDDPEMVRDMQGPILNFGSPQSENAEALLELPRSILLADPMYVERIKEHYRLFRSKIDNRVSKARHSRKMRKGKKRGMRID